MKKVFPLVFLHCLALALPAQVNTDSLWSIWNDRRQPDTSRLAAIQAMAWSMLYNNPDSTHGLAQQELFFAVKIRNKKWEAKALNVIGSTYNLKGNYIAALDSYRKGLAAMQEAGDKKGIAALSNNIGLVFRNLGNNPKALEYYEKDLAIQEELKDKDGIANAYNNIGTIYNDQANFPKALEYYQKSMYLQEALGDKFGMAISYNNVGSVYNDQGAYSRALEYYYKSLALREELDDRRGIGIVYSNIGLLYKDRGLYDKALECYQKSLAIQEKLAEKPGLSSSYYNMGALYQEQKSYAKAIHWCKKSLDISREIKAIRPERNACNCLYEAFKGLGQTAQALRFHERYVLLNDSLLREETDKRLEQMEFAKQIITDSLGKEEEKLKLEMIHQDEVRGKNRILNILLLSGLVLLVLALGFLSRMLYFRRYSQMFQDKAEHLEKQQLLNEIALLRTQVNPHFLFNSLSILASLVRVDPDLSEQFIDQLSRSYRYILEQKEQSLVSLRTELEFIQSYSFLLKIRFEKKFDLRFDLPENMPDQYKIAPLTLQLLIENAVKHNRMSLREPLVVEVSAENNDTLVVKNRLQPRNSPSVSTGLGLQNIINRYALLTDRPVRAGEQEEAFVVKLPLLH